MAGVPVANNPNGVPHIRARQFPASAGDFTQPPMPIPVFDHNRVLPPHLGNPTFPGQLSPYPCTSLELCQALGTSPDRRVILGRFLDFRERLWNEGLKNGFQWLDGSFLEDVETLEGRPPRDLDAVTIYWGYDLAFQVDLTSRFPEFANPALSKANFSVDHYPFDATANPVLTVESARYWSLLFSHSRTGVWKGMLRVELNTPNEDAGARAELAKPVP